MVRRPRRTCAVGGELQSATAALEQCGAEFGLERVDQFGDGLQRDALLARGGRQAAALGGREEVLNGLELVHQEEGVSREQAEARN